MLLPVSALVLAGGRGRRMRGENKLLLPVKNTTVIRAVMDQLCRLPFSEIIVVLGYQHEVLAEHLAAYPVSFVTNQGYKQGVATAMKLGIQATSPESEGYLIALGDMPLIKETTLNQLLKAFLENPAVTIPVYAGRRGYPVIFPKHYRDRLLEMPKDQHPKTLTREEHPSVNQIEVADQGILVDVDTPTAYKQVLKLTAAPKKKR